MVTSQSHWSGRMHRDVFKVNTTTTDYPINLLSKPKSSKMKIQKNHLVTAAMIFQQVKPCTTIITIGRLPIFREVEMASGGAAD